MTLKTDWNSPKLNFPAINSFYTEAVEYVEKHYSNNYGFIYKCFVYPITHAESEYWLNQFFENNFSEFGDFEDAIVGNENLLNHSVISPLLNIGLLLRVQVVESALNFAREKTCINEFIGGLYPTDNWLERIHTRCLRI